MSNKVDTTDFKRAKKYGFWTGKYRLDPLPLPDWPSMPWYKRIWSRLTYTRLYEFENDKKDPLTFNHPEKCLIRPDAHFTTDMGSVPKKLQGLIPWLFAKDLWLKDYILHDSGYAHGGLWFAKRDKEIFTFCKLRRSVVDNLLALSIKASGGGCFSSGPIWFGVMMGGWLSYDKGDLAKKEN